MLVYQFLPRLWNAVGNSTSEPRSGKFGDVDERFLGYLSDMGFTHLWMTGVVRHATTVPFDGCPPSADQVVKGKAGSPYAIVDYYDVNPYMADNVDDRMGEFESLIRRVRLSGLKLIIDFVPNHVARDYGLKGLVREGVRALGADDDRSVHWKPENDFYYYPGQALTLPSAEGMGVASGYSEMPAKASGNCFSPSPGVNDWYETVRINYCDFHTPTWDKMLDIVRYWCRKGVDGFRCDMVEMVPWQFFKWLIAKIKEEFPKVIFVAEVYSREQYRHYVEEVGFDLLYDKSGLYDSLRALVEGHGTARSITWNWQSLGDLQPHMLNFLENHDEQRFASDFFGHDARRSFAALAAGLLFNTSPYMVYNGEEIGERGMDCEGFSGRDGRTTIFDWWTPGYAPSLIEWIRTGKGLNDNEMALLERWRSALRTASSEPAFSRGSTFDLCYCNEHSAGFDPERQHAFLRGVPERVFLVVCNFSGQEVCLDVNIPREAFCHLGNDRGSKLIRGISVPADDYVLIPV